MKSCAGYLPKLGRVLHNLATACIARNGSWHKTPRQWIALNSWGKQYHCKHENCIGSVFSTMYQQAVFYCATSMLFKAAGCRDYLQSGLQILDCLCMVCVARLCVTFCLFKLSPHSIQLWALMEDLLVLLQFLQRFTHIEIDISGKSSCCYLSTTLAPS